MPGYQVAIRSLRINGSDYLIRSLLDHEQYHDPDGEAGRLGIFEEEWPLFGQVWPAGEVLASAMSTLDLNGRRILELGAGLALPSLVAHRRGGDMTVSDYHPSIPDFLRENLRLNQLGPIKYRAADWSDPSTDLGKFDLIIGSDLLYQADQAEALADFVDRHADAGAEVLIIDPDRGYGPRFRELMTGLRFTTRIGPANCLLGNGELFEGTWLRFKR